MTDQVVETYETNAARLAEKFDRIPTEDVLAEVMDYLYAPPASLLDVGAGSGRDAAWFAQKGYAVTVAEPVPSFRKAITKRLPEIPILDARLPGLSGVSGSFDMILASGVWHHLNPTERDQGFRRLADLLCPNGRLILSLRDGPAGHGGMVHAMDPSEELRRAEAAGLIPVRQATASAIQDDKAAAGVTFTWMVLELAS